MKKYFNDILFLFMTVSSFSERFTIEQFSLNIYAYPSEERLVVHIRFHVTGSGSLTRLSGYMTEPRTVLSCTEERTGKEVLYTFQRISAQHEDFHIKEVVCTLPEPMSDFILSFEYEYGREEFTVYCLNPSTWDNFHYGQITSRAIHSSHNYYYPVFRQLEDPENAENSLHVPSGWVGVTVSH